MSQTSSPRAVSLIELLVVMAIVALLMAILLAALAGTQHAAQRMRSLSNLRNIAATFREYAQFHQGRYPIAGDRAYPYCGTGNVSLQFDPWLTDIYWPIVMYQHAPWDEFFDVLHSPGVQRSLHDETCGHPTSYYYSRSFLARPELWQEGATASRSLLTGTTLTEVRYPSNKVLAWDWEMPFLGRDLSKQGPDLAESTPMLFADGHTASNVPANATPPVSNPFFPDQEPKRLHNTRDGIRGRDYLD